MQANLVDLDQPAEESVSLGAGLLAGTPVLTLDGEIPVQFLAPGDRIVTRVGARRLVDVTVQVVERADVVRVSASALGHDRPAEDVILAPGQTILVRDWRAKALYGTAEAAVPATRLADGDYIRCETLPEARFFTLRFAAEVVIYAGGLELACAPALAHA